MDNVDMQTIAAMLVRHGLTVAAGILVTHGYIMANQTEQYISAFTLILGLAWSAWQKVGHAKVAAELAQLKGKGGK